MAAPGALTPRYAVLCGFAQLGERDRAFAILDDLVASRSGQAVFSAVDPALDPIRDDPRFERILRRLALPERASTT
jgi:adenylate cyclase